MSSLYFSHRLVIPDGIQMLYVIIEARSEELMDSIQLGIAVSPVDGTLASRVYNTTRTPDLLIRTVSQLPFEQRDNCKAVDIIFNEEPVDVKVNVLTAVDSKGELTLLD